jgi:oligoendopeptidase F
LAQEQQLETEYNRIIGAQVIECEVGRLTIPQMAPIFENPDRQLREKAWRLMYSRQLADRLPLNDLWRRYLALRVQIAKNADFDNYRSYVWKRETRFDYTPEDCKKFHSAIEKIVVPVAARIYENARKRLGVESLRPWDLLMFVGSSQGYGLVIDVKHEPLRPFKDESELKAKCASIFDRVDPQLGEYFHTMLSEGLLDLGSRPDKAPGAYSMRLPASKRSFIFMNAVGTHDDVQTLLHESGHTFHNFERNQMPYFQSLVGLEFSEVASIGMQLLAGPYLSADQGGFYSNADAALARRSDLELLILHLPHIAVVDAFQHWVYENPGAAMNPDSCDEEWVLLWKRFMIGVDWNGLDDCVETGWQRLLHIFVQPFYFIEYAISTLGAVQVWRNALRDQAAAVASYRRGLALGGTVSLPALFSAVGAKLDMSVDALKPAVELLKNTIDELSTQ